MSEDNNAPKNVRAKWLRPVQVYLVALMIASVTRGCLIAAVEPGFVGVRYNNALGLLEADLSPGYHFELLGLQRIWSLPTKYLFLTYADQDTLNIRTKDNNTVTVDVSVPIRIQPGKAHLVMKAGNHITDASGAPRYCRLASDTTVGVLREHLAQLQSSDFYNTTRRLEVGAETLTILNKELAPFHVEAQTVLIRASYFRPEYEEQLAEIQLNEQNKLLDGARKLVADKKQTLDNFAQRTVAMSSSKAQDWERRIAELERTYQVGYLEVGEDQTPGAARRRLNEIDATKKDELRAAVAAITGLSLDEVSEDHLLGIQNISAETKEYDQRVRSAAEGVSARLSAEGQARLAQVEGQYESKLNRLLASPGGRAFVAYQAADNVTFDSSLVFQSSDGIPSILRLRNFAERFMGM